MARFRRRIIRRRPFRRPRRRFVARRRLRKRATGNLFCKLTKVSTFEVNQDVNSVWDGSFVPEDFDEFKSLAKNFEAVKIYRVRLTVFPLQNVSNNSTSSMPSYAMTPWHYGIDPPKEFRKYLSMDRSKMIRGTSMGTQSYVPNVMSNVLTQDNPPIAQSNMITWRPTLRTNASQETYTLPRIRCGVIAFQGESGMEGRKGYFNIKTDVWVKFIGQSIMHI